jgi:hypothetical protein
MTSKAEKARAKKAAVKKADVKAPPTPPAPVAAVSAPTPPISLDDAVIEGSNGSRFVVEGLARDLPRSLVLDERLYEHVDEDEHGRWVYRA